MKANCIQCNAEFNIKKGRNGKPTTHCSNACAAITRQRKPDERGWWKCRGCDLYLDAIYFTENKNFANGLDSTCRPCRSEEHRNWRENIENYNRFSIASRYGISKLELDKMYEDQDSKCMACGDFYEVLHLDHDHSCCPTGGSCGKCIRGLLCKYCNSVLGFVNDEVSRLNKLIHYLHLTQREKERYANSIKYSGDYL